MPEEITEKDGLKQKRTAQSLRKRLGKASSESAARHQAYNQARGIIVESLRDGARTVPEIADSTGLPSHEVFWHLMAMKKYGKLAEGQERDDYYEYVLSDDLEKPR